jgi:hypothetical protein
MRHQGVALNYLNTGTTLSYLYLLVNSKIVNGTNVRFPSVIIHRRLANLLFYVGVKIGFSHYGNNSVSVCEHGDEEGRTNRRVDKIA